MTYLCFHLSSLYIWYASTDIIRFENHRVRQNNLLQLFSWKDKYIDLLI